MPNYPLIPGTLPGGYCPASYQQLYNDFFGLGFAQAPAVQAYIWTGATPPIDFTTYPLWAPLDGAGAPMFPGLFGYDTAFGGWTAKHPVPANSSMVVLWIGTLAAIDTFDGGAAGAISAYTGPMWVVVAALAARFPVGVGTFPSGAGVAIGATGGEEKHQLVVTELPSHNHPVTYSGDLITNPGGTPNLKTQGYPGGIGANTGDTGGDVAHNNVPPYYGVYFIQRTLRTHYTSPI